MQEILQYPLEKTNLTHNSNFSKVPNIFLPEISEKKYGIAIPGNTLDINKGELSTEISIGSGFGNDFAIKTGNGITIIDNSLTTKLGNCVEHNNHKNTVILGDGLSFDDTGSINVNSGKFITTDSTNGINLNVGNGLISNTSGVSCKAGNGISVTNDNISVNAGKGITVNSSGIHLKPGRGIIISDNKPILSLGSGMSFDSSNRLIADVPDPPEIQVGDGLTKSGNVISAKPGNGIKANIDKGLYISPGRNLKITNGALAVSAATSSLSAGHGISIGGNNIISTIPPNIGILKTTAGEPIQPFFQSGQPPSTPAAMSSYLTVNLSEPCWISFSLSAKNNGTSYGYFWITIYNVPSKLLHNKVFLLWNRIPSAELSICMPCASGITYVGYYLGDGIIATSTSIYKHPMIKD